MTTTETTTHNFYVPVRFALTLKGEDAAAMRAGVALRDVLTPLAQHKDTPFVPDEKALVQLARIAVQAGQRAFHLLEQDLEKLEGSGEDA